MLLKALVTIEGVGSRLHPEFNLVEELEPLVKKSVRENPRARYLPYDLYFTGAELLSFLRDLPFEAKQMLRLMKGGELRMQFEHRGLEAMIARHDQFVNRLVFAIVLASLIIGSSVVIHSGIPPKFHEIPIVGIVGFALAGIIGFGLLFSIIRHRKM
jgi:ubiquinone biosynthesis protein